MRGGSSYENYEKGDEYKNPFIKNEITSEAAKVISIFSTPILKTNIGRDFTEEELQLFLMDIPMWKDEQKKMTPHRSKDHYLFDNFAEKLKDIKKFCEHHLKIYLKEIEGANTDLAKLRITQSWLNRTKPGESQHLHHHSNSHLTAVLYIHCLPKDCINFNNRLHGMYNNMNFPLEKITEWNSDGVIIDVTEGDLVISPSGVAHFVDENKTKNRERISLSFNTFPIGEMGEYEGANQLKL